MFAKIFASLWDGTLYGKSDAQLVFVYLLAHADPDGNVDIAHPMIAAATGMPVDRAREATAFLEAADPESRSSDDGGARLVRMDEHRTWGWNIVNYAKYRTMVDGDTVRAQTRERVRKHREKKRAETGGNGQKRQGEGEVEGEVEAKKKSQKKKPAAASKEIDAALIAKCEARYPEVDVSLVADKVIAEHGTHARARLLGWCAAAKARGMDLKPKPSYLQRVLNGEEA